LTNGSVIQLDWDQRVFKLPNWRIRHLGDDWRGLNVIELYALIRRADLVVGCDSGVLHFCRFTNTPAIGVWTKYHPSHFALPRANTLHVVSQYQAVLSRNWRVTYNIVECPNEEQMGRFIAEQAARVFSPRKYLNAAVPDTVLRHLIDNCRQYTSLVTTFVDRHRTFEAFLSIATRKAKPCIVETGTIREVEAWQVGYSTYLFGYFLHHHGQGELHSVDLSLDNVRFAQDCTREFARVVHIHLADGRTWLQNYSGPPIDLLYLDSADVGTPGYQQCALDEVEAALPYLAPDAVVLFDDTCWNSGAFWGKGSLAVPWLLQRGWKIAAGGYQVLLSKTEIRGLHPENVVQTACIMPLQTSQPPQADRPLRVPRLRRW
jgi:predicted O-methyltransferase YrrM